MRRPAAIGGRRRERRQRARLGEREQAAEARAMEMARLGADRGMAQAAAAANPGVEGGAVRFTAACWMLTARA
jgi:hypothetical protein